MSEVINEIIEYMSSGGDAAHLHAHATLEQFEASAPVDWRETKE